ncbi:integration host factor [Marinitoga sp. 1135]|uniref:Bacterial nucleoid DNA-binding protein n=1 Tax=Marinitoga piezophila (strain DSM 14283 / JCM 11233 / KA3) TaxID=443254 RepID=H2J7L5_MARPK|nr:MULTISPECIES: HU family DNA-binding protein [Marinitoga]AEX85356.1 bacterial nucleoid DNA-binding protein [Marinitoga piezophila KA3]APT75834.1 integration host factor [Marinitoga sp. 1137]NUU95630.1 integration host factor [Marinitoga sp. 1135]NUU97491.1 integration host factor [Marinitoga sp. 1138]
MNKKELVSALAEKLSVTKKEAALFVDSFVDVVSEALSKGDNVKIVGFGTFEVVERKPRKGVNPQTKETIEIPGGKVPKFKAGKELKAKVK